MKYLKGMHYDIKKYTDQKDFNRAVAYSPAHNEIKIDTNFGFIIINYSFDELEVYLIEIRVNPKYSSTSDEALINETNTKMFATLMRGNMYNK